MIEEKAILHFNKFKSLKDHYMKDLMTGQILLIEKVKMIRDENQDFTVKISVKNELTGHVQEFDSTYANMNFREVQL